MCCTRGFNRCFTFLPAFSSFIIHDLTTNCFHYPVTFSKPWLCKHGGRGREERAGLRSCHPSKGANLSGSACKNGTSRKIFEEAYSNVEVARQACTVFASSTSEGVAKTSHVPLFPSSRDDCLKPNGYKIKRTLLLRILVVHYGTNGLLSAAGRIMKRSCEPQPLEIRINPTAHVGVIERQGIFKNLPQPRYFALCRYVARWPTAPIDQSVPDSGYQKLQTASDTC